MATKQKQKVDLLDDKIGELENKWKRALADYANLQKRVENERFAFAKMANATLIIEILGILDDLERAAGHLKDEGLELVLKRFGELLKREEVVEIKAMGNDFDPESMEAVESVKGDENRVMKVVQKGYMMGETVLRPVKVEVGNGRNK